MIRIQPGLMIYLHPISSLRVIILILLRTSSIQPFHWCNQPQQMSVSEGNSSMKWTQQVFFEIINHKDYLEENFPCFPGTTRCLCPISRLCELHSDTLTIISVILIVLIVLWRRLWCHSYPNRRHLKWKTKYGTRCARPLQKRWNCVSRWRVAYVGRLGFLNCRVRVCVYKFRCVCVCVCMCVCVGVCGCVSSSYL